MEEKIAMWKSVMNSERKKKFDWKLFWRHNAERILKIVALVLLVLVPCLTVRHNVIVKMEMKYEKKLSEAIAQAEQQTTERLMAQYGNPADNAEKAEIAEESKVLAKMLYAYRNNSDNGVKSACWCAINRVDSKYYPNTMQGVCEQKSQWMGWSEENPVLQKLYDIAYEQLALWHSGMHLVDPDFVYMEWSPKEITLKTEFSGRGHFWYESDWAKA